jgi:hypothetical protein
MAINTQKFFKKIHDDSVFYAKNYLKIRTKDGELVNFELNPMQIKSERLIYKHQVSKNKPIRVIWLKARQHGISTYCEAKIFHNTANNPFKNAMIIAHEDKATQNLFAMSKLFYEELPAALRPMKKYSNESALTFENPTNNDEEKYNNPGLRSKITVATAKNVDTGRSATIHALHCSEVAFWDNPETLMTGLLQCVPDNPNTMIFIESTANGVGGYFYDMWKKAERGENDFLPIFLGWHENPEYSRKFSSYAEKKAFIDAVMTTSIDEKGNVIKTEERILKETFGLTWEQLNWRKWCIANNLNGDIEKFRQEYPATPDEAFIASGRPQFSITALKKYLDVVKEPIKSGYLNEKNGKIELDEDEKGYVKIWRMPEQNKFYCIGADVAEGLITGDYSCGIVLDEDFRLCASWHGHCDPDVFGEELVKLARFYNDAYVGVESNNNGSSTLRAIVRKEYWNIYYQKSYNKIVDSMTQKIGWNTNIRTKPIMINTLTAYIREMWLELPWETLISECLTYVKGDDGITTNAQNGCHDDTVMALAIALQLLLEGRDESYEPEIPRDQKYINDPLEISANCEEYEDLSIDKYGDEEYTI